MFNLKKLKTKRCFLIVCLLFLFNNFTTMSVAAEERDNRDDFLKAQSSILAPQSSPSLTSGSGTVDFFAGNASTDGTYTENGAIKNGDLDVYLFRSDVSTHMDGRLTFGIKIDRYFGEVYPDGSLKNLSQLIAEKKIPERVTLQMRVWDVDHESTTPERDYVYINRTNKIGRDNNTSWGGLEHLTSGNNTWSILSCSIPVSWLKFPEKPTSGENIIPRENLIQVDIDVLYLTNWAITVDFARLTFETKTPIVFIHGKGSNSLEWSMFDKVGKKSTNGGFREWFDKKGYQTYTIDYWSQGNPILNNGHAVRDCTKETRDNVGINNNNKTRDYIDNNGDGDPGTTSMDQDPKEKNVLHTTNIVTGTAHDDLKSTNDYRFSKNLKQATEDSTTWRGLEQLKDLKKMGINKINIIAHSMGGLVSRYYISEILKNNKTDYPAVENLFMVSTPNHGSAAASTPILAWMLDNSDARSFLTPNNIKKFNASYPNSSDVKYFTIGGYGGRKTDIANPCHWYADYKNYSPGETQRSAYLSYGILGGAAFVSSENIIQIPVLSPYPHLETIHVPNDDLVTIQSSQLNGAQPLDNFDLNHHTIRASENVAQAIYSKLESLNTLSPSSELASTKKIASAPAVEEAPPIPQQITYSGTISPGETIILTPSIVAWSMMCVLNWNPAENLDMALEDPNGVMISNSERLQDAMVIAYNKIEEVKNGIWTIQIKGQNITQPVNYMVNILMTGALISMTADTGKLTYAKGDAVTVWADIKEMQSDGPVTGATVTAAITLPDESTQTVTLYDNGTNGDASASDGRYTSNTFTAIMNGGYKVNVHAAGFYSSASFIRDASLIFKAIEPGSQLNGTVNMVTEDSDSDGLYDFLTAEVGLDVSIAGSYRVVASLYDSTDNLIEASSGTVDMATGSGIIKVQFSGKLIRKNGVNGPYTVKNIILVNSDGDTLDEDNGQHNTSAYLYTDFERDDVLLTGVNTDEGIDTNANSLYDFLRITTGVDVVKSGNYEFNARLLDSYGNEIAWANGSTSISAGIGNIVLNFLGQNIRRSLDNGPYVVSDLSITSSGAVLLYEQNTYTTSGSYDYEQFETIISDLTIADISFSKPTIFPNETVTITAAIKNSGNATTGSFNIRFYNGNPFTTGTLVGETSITGIETGEEKPADVAWNTSGLLTGEYEIYVHVNYDKSLAEFDYSNNIFSHTVSIGTMTLNLNAGWNLISLNCQPQDTDINNLLSQVSNKVISVWAYDNNNWKLYTPLNPAFSDLSTIEPGIGYWFNMNDSALLEVNGSAPSKTKSLIIGWNLVGYNGSSSQSVTDALSSIEGKYISAWGFINGNWKVYNPANPGFSDLTEMAPGLGYWINASEACTWTLP